MAVTQSNGLNRRDTMSDDETRAESDEIRRDIDRTRSEMDSTIDELGQRLQPRNLFDEIVASVKSSLFSDGSYSTNRSMGSRELAEQAGDTASRVGRSLIEGVRENPVPAALMGAGLAWLLFEDKAERAYRRHRLASNAEEWQQLKSRSGSYVDARTGKPYDASYGAGYADLDYDGEPDVEPKSMMDKASETAGSIKQAVQGAAGALGSAASSVGSAAGKTAQAAKQSAHAVSGAARKTRFAAASSTQALGEFGRAKGESLRHARDSARNYGHEAAESLSEMKRLAADKTRLGYQVSRERFDTALDESPLAVGVAALAVGLLAGFALPRTRVEDRTIGRGADDFREEAMRRGREVVEQGKEVASHLADEALGDAESQGLTPDSLSGKVSRVAKEAVHAAKDAARREGIDADSLADKARHIGQTVKEKGKAEVEQVAGQSISADKTEKKSEPVAIGEATGAACSPASPAAGSMGTTKSSSPKSGDLSKDKNRNL